MSFSAIYPFDLPLLPPSVDFNDLETTKILLRARTELGELKGYSSALPNPMLLLSPAVLKESVVSSRIENINTTVENVLQMQLFPEIEQQKPEKEVLHYREALLWGFEQLNKLPLSTRVVAGVQKRLLPESAGGYRRLQNSIQDAAAGKVIYTPPPAQKIPGLMGNWENFIHSENDLDPLIKCVVAHYQFEAIHPFLDGNGRTGRILIVLYLVEQGFLSIPLLYVSGYINKNRAEYYRLLNEVSSKQSWKHLVNFLLNALYLQAKETKETLTASMDLHRRMREKIKTDFPKIYSADLVEALFTYPIISPVNLGKTLNIHYTTASRYLVALAGAKILGEAIVGKYHFFVNKKLLELLKK
jgi:Fic family protein